MPRRIERYRAIFETLGQPARGSIFRGVPLEYQPSPLSAIGSINKGGRYNQKGAFEMLYFANDGDTVLRETRIVKYDAGGTPISVPTRAYVVISLRYDVSHLVDLTDPAIQAALKLDDTALTADWEVAILNGRKPITQDIGHAARAAGIEAIIVPSARDPGYRTPTPSSINSLNPAPFGSTTPTDSTTLQSSTFAGEKETNTQMIEA